VGVVQEPVGGRGGQRLGHELVKRGRVQVAADRDGALLVGGVDEAVEAFGGVGADGQQANVISLCGCPHRSTKWATSRSSKTPRTCSSSSFPRAMTRLADLDQQPSLRPLGRRVRRPSRRRRDDRQDRSPRRRHHSQGFFPPAPEHRHRHAALRPSRDHGTLTRPAHFSNVKSAQFSSVVDRCVAAPDPLHPHQRHRATSGGQVTHPHRSARVRAGRHPALRVRRRRGGSMACSTGVPRHHES